MNFQKKYLPQVGAVLLVLLVFGWVRSIFGVMSDANQGEVYRILYLHVPSVITAFASSLLLCLFSLGALRTRSEALSLVARASAEVGLLYTAITLISGAIWGKPTWGVWWSWDARLTTTFFLFVLYSAYLFLWSALEPQKRTKICAVVGVMIFIDIPIIYKSVSWWRTLHQPPSLFRSGGATMDPEMLTQLLISCVLCFCLGAWMIWQRAYNLLLQEKVEEAALALE